MKSILTVGATAVLLTGLIILSAILPGGAEGEARAAAATESPVLYIVRQQDGYLAVFVPDKKQPIEITDIDVRTLTREDRESVSRGIFLYSEQQLSLLLEDLES